MKSCILAAMCCLLSIAAAAQQHSIKGSVLDTASNVRLQNSSISILTAKDSMLVGFTRAAEDGSFKFETPRDGDFILLVSYPDYADYVARFSLSAEKPTHDFGRIRMTLAARLLEEVIVKGTVAEIEIKGDTTEFNAAAFKIEPNSKVEDLLKQLPGIQVDQNGKITAQGQTVNKVLVDGEEFFGDDPTLVTKNIRGDMVDKVQLYDKKSDQATFTGIDDGERTKTLNIKLKEDKKTGYFGKVEAGGGSDDFYTGQAMFNYFKGKSKASAYGTIGNNGKTGLGWQENSRLGVTTNTTTEEGYIIIGSVSSDELDSFDGRYNGEGIPQTQSGGVHYDTKWNEDKHSLNLNYKVGTIQVTGANNTLNQNNLPSGIINSNSDQAFDNYMFRHKVDATYLVKIDSTADLKVTVDGTIKNSQSESNSTYSSIRNSGTALNNSLRTLSNDADQNQFNSNLLLTKKFRKKGRTISLTLGQRFSKEDAEGFLNSENQFYNLGGALDSIQLIDQYKTNFTRTSSVNSNAVYTEPITKTLTLALNYGLNLTDSRADRRSFNQSAPGRYDVLDRQFSNDFDLNQTSNQLGATFNYRKGKTVINVGTRTSLVEFEQIDRFSGTEYSRNFMNWLPQASYQYNFAARRSFRVSYNGMTQQPGISQIQPIRINNDPLNITLGNPDLGPAFQNRFNIGYDSYKVLSDQSIYISGSASFTSDAIVNNTVTDAAGKNTFQSVNLGGKSPYSYSIYGGYSRKIGSADWRWGLNTSLSLSTFYNLINNSLNKTISNRYAGGTYISKTKLKKFSIYASLNPSYITNEASLQRFVNNNGWTFNTYFEGSLYLPGKMQIVVDGSHMFQQKTQTFNQNFDRTLVNTRLIKSMLKGETLKLTLSGNDLFNQNTGFSRRATSNMITQNSYTTIRRYVMFSASYDLSRMGGPQAPKP